jgi:hypothetical protein
MATWTEPCGCVIRNHVRFFPLIPSPRRWDLSINGTHPHRIRLDRLMVRGQYRPCREH